MRCVTPRINLMLSVKLATCLVALCINLPASGIANAQSASTSHSSTKVDGEGYGSTQQSAIDNAIRNALMSAAGSYINSETSMERKTKIENGIRTFSKSLNERVSEYSNGIVEDVKINSVRNEGQEYYASVKITVRSGELRTYVLQLAEGRNSISEGLFSEVRANVASTNNLESSINQLFGPILDGKAIRISISKPLSLANIDYSEIAVNHIREKASKISDPSVVFIKAKIFIDDEYYKKIVDFLNYSAAENSYSRDFDQTYYSFWEKYTGSGSHSILLTSNRNLSNERKDYGRTRLGSDKIYALRIPKDRFNLSNFCTSRTLGGDYPQGLIAKTFTIKFYNNEGFSSERIIRHEAVRSEYGNRTEIKTFVINDRGSYEYLPDDPYNNFDLFTSYYPTGRSDGNLHWSLIACTDFMVPVLQKEVLMDIFVKMTPQELEAATNISIKIGP